MFIINYIPTNQKISIVADAAGMTTVGEKWQVDTDEDGNLAAYEELETALERVKKIRELGGEACLSVVIE